jgi:ABC-type Fe3+/spermidine/putrescine transport system ATPase subunit
MGSISFRSVDKVFGGRSSGVKALDDINLEIVDKEFVAIVGPSGCGKTTCLRMVAGFEAPSSGIVAVNGKAVTRRDRTARWSSSSSPCSPGRRCGTTSTSGCGTRACGKPSART